MVTGKKENQAVRRWFKENKENIPPLIREEANLHTKTGYVHAAGYSIQSQSRRGTPCFPAGPSQQLRMRLDPSQLMWEITTPSCGNPRAENATPLQPTSPLPCSCAVSCILLFCWGKGKIQISTTNGQAWTWRRIIFTAKGTIIPGAYRDYSQRSVTLSNNTTYYQRANSPLPAQMASDLYRYLFRGLGTNNDGQLPRD